MLWGTAAVNTWNARRAAVLSWLAWCRERGHDGPAVPAWAKRMAPPDSRDAGALEDGDRPADRPAGGTPAGEDAVADAVRDRRAAEEILGVNIEDLDLAGRRCPVKAKGARRRPAAAARRARTSCSRPSTGTPAPPGCCPGCSRAVPAGRSSSPTAARARARSSARATLPGHRVRPPVVRAGPRAAGRPHRRRRAGHRLGPARVRHSCLTHLGEAGASLLMLMAKSRHRKPENLRRYFHPSPGSDRRAHQRVPLGARPPERDR